MSRSNSGGAVVVWCYLRSNKKSIKTVFGPAISNTIEANYMSFLSSNAPNNPICRFPVDQKKASKWVNYEIQLQTLTMENKTTGDVHQMCREVCAPSSIFSQGYEWVVKGDGPREWIPYDFDSSQLIEDAVSAKISNSLCLDLSKTTTGLPYNLDLKGRTYTQTNKYTGKKRKIRRQPLLLPYTSVPVSSPSSSASQQMGATAAQATKKPKIDGRSGTSSHLPASALSSSVPLSRSLSSTEYEEVTESLPRERSIRISRDTKAKDEKNALDIEKYMTAVTDASEMDADCIICMETLKEDSGFGEGSDQAKDVVKLAICEHAFHKLCLLAMYDNDHKEDCLECPSCKTIYGEKCGNCPPGEMLWEIRKGFSIPGYEGYNVIRLIYAISPGVQGPGDPNPGSRYRAAGFPREGYLPDCNKGRRVLKLLIEAFKRKLMFTIGTSITTGQSNTVTWNEIHLKTEATSNISGHGYPDPLYLDNVLMELASHGVSEESGDVPP